jgi:demethylmenaquinone methyltransferase/2-methoxy-6-polyprenyl-1,4-benzoquinol methylase
MSEPLQPDDDVPLAEQAAYYRARAREYDEWWQRQGRYDRGAKATARWRDEVAQVSQALDDLHLAGDVLELACGTGWWTERLARGAATLTCVDASPEALAINRARLAGAGLALPRYVEADLFAWAPERAYDVVFFSFWLSHVPPERFDRFWGTVAEALKPGGRAVLIDSLPDETSTAHDHRMPDEAGLQERRLNDGRTFRIVKLFREPGELASRLAGLGWRAEVSRTPTYFVYGSATRT